MANAQNSVQHMQTALVPRPTGSTMYRSVIAHSRAAFWLPSRPIAAKSSASIPIASRQPSRIWAAVHPQQASNASLTNSHVFGGSTRAPLHTSALLANIVPPQREITSTISESDYHRHSDATLERLLEALETLGDEIELAGYDVTCSSGVLTVKLGVHGTYVLNKQPPNKQVWMSSPVSGPRRFDWNDQRGVWVDSRQDAKVAEELVDVLVREFDEVLEVKLEEFLPPVE